MTLAGGRDNGEGAGSRRLLPAPDRQLQSGLAALLVKLGETKLIRRRMILD
jgi:hypothetical protein